VSTSSLGNPRQPALAHKAAKAPRLSTHTYRLLIVKERAARDYATEIQGVRVSSSKEARL